MTMILKATIFGTIQIVKKLLLKLPRLDLPEHWKETTIDFSDAMKPMTKISSIYASDSKWPIEKIFTVFVEEKPIKPERAYCIHRPWYIRLYQLSYFEEDT